MCVTSNKKSDWMTIFYYYYVKDQMPDSMMIECESNRKLLNDTSKNRVILPGGFTWEDVNMIKQFLQNIDDTIQNNNEDSSFNDEDE